MEKADANSKGQTVAGSTNFMKVAIALNRILLMEPSYLAPTDATELSLVDLGTM